MRTFSLSQAQLRHSGPTLFLQLALTTWNRILLHWVLSFFIESSLFLESGRTVWNCNKYSGTFSSSKGPLLDESGLFAQYYGGFLVQAILYKTNTAYVCKWGPVSVSKGYGFIQFLCLMEWKGMESSILVLFLWVWPLFYKSGPFTNN